MFLFHVVDLMSNKMYFSLEIFCMQTQPINLLFRFFQNKNYVSVIFQNNKYSRIIGKISGFDEFMNIVIDNASEINLKGKKNFLGCILIKGDCIAVISEA
jgi:small nuclear ribonucleoprotein E